MQVGLVTNTGEHCGISEYGRNLMEYVPGVEYKILGRPFTLESVLQGAQDVDLLHFNYSAAISPFFENDFRELRRQLPNKKLLITLHDSFTERLRGLSALGIFDRIVSHEKGDFPADVVHIPQGIREADVSDVYIKYKMGIAGFPFPWKGFYPASKVAHKLGMGCLAIMNNDCSVMDAKQMRSVVLKNCPTAEVVTEWMEHEQVVRRLAECAIVAFPYDLDYRQQMRYGISAAVRFGLATKRPIIVSQCRQFMDLWDYPDEVYVVENGKGDDLLWNLELMVKRVLADIEAGKEKRPKQLVEDMSWTRCGKLYADLYREMI